MVNSNGKNRPPRLRRIIKIPIKYGFVLRVYKIVLKGSIIAPPDGGVGAVGIPGGADGAEGNETGVVCLVFGITLIWIVIFC